MHFWADITLAGVKDPPIPHDPDSSIKQKIKVSRKWIGRLTVAKNSNNITKKVSNFIKGDTLVNSFTTLKLKLGSVS